MPLRADELPLRYNCVDILERNLESRGDKQALFSAERVMTFGEVSAEVNKVGNALRGRGVREGEYVGLLSLDQPAWVTSFFGIVKVGGIAIGMNTMLKPYEVQYILEDARPRVVIVHESLLNVLEVIRDKLDFLAHVIVIGTARRDEDVSFVDWIEAESTECAAAPSHRDDFCSLNYSSGTTGEPKGILHAHKDYPITAHNWGVDVMSLTEDDRTFAGAKLFFTFGLGGNLIFPWYVGASVVLLSGSPRVVASVLGTVDRFKPTILYNAPTGYAMTMATEGFSTDYDLSSLRLCVSAGEALPAPIWQQWKEQTGLTIIDGIGSTEAFHIFISNWPDDVRPGSSGKPVPGFDVRLVDDEFNDVAQGEVGNLLVKGEATALFYLHQSQRSRDTYIGEWLFTGDKYVVDEDGYYWHAGRSDDMLKVGGIWTSPVEVESALIAHPAVMECAVVGKTDDADLVKPKAFVILNPGHEPTEDLKADLVTHCVEKLAAYKRPRWIEFVAELPKTATGKIQRFKLRG